MKTKRYWIAAFAALSFGVALALPQDKKPVEAGAALDPAVMAKMKEYGTPGPAHKVLEAKVGKWNGQVKTWMAPDTEPATSTATSEAKWILDGHFLTENFSGEFHGQKFNGQCLTGYDNLKQKYFFTFVDNMGTGMALAEGTYDPASKTFTYAMEHPCPEAGKYIKGRVVDKTIDADHYTWQMYTTSPEGKEFMAMEIQYARAK